MSATVARKSRCNAGSATFTAVPSIKAMLEARIVAARIQPAEDFGHGSVEGPARITPSLQGSRIIVVIVGDALEPACAVYYR
jgi:hypothetical protein